MVYRDDVGALEARLTTLETELAAKTRQRDEAARLLVEAKARASNDALAADWAAGGPQRRRKRRLAVFVSSVMAVTAGLTLYVKLPGRVDRERALVERSIAQFERFADEMCDCRDSQCAEAVSTRMTNWSSDLVKGDPKPPRVVDEPTMTRMQTIATHMSECMQKAMSAPPL